MNRFIGIVKKRIKNLDVLVNVAGIWHGKNEVFAGKNLTEFSEKTVLSGKIYVMKKGQEPFTAFHY